MQKTKKSLLLSAISLALCCAMLVGTTFAWFTDSVTSGKNKIVAGNLDIDLMMDKAQDGTYVSIADEDAAVFGGENSLVAQNKSSDTLWEPGKTQIVFLGVKNLGTLAAKYNIELTVTDNGLAGALEYAVVDGVTKTLFDAFSVTDWATIKTLSGVQTGSMGDFTYDDTTKQAVITAAENGVLDEGKDEIQYFALAVHMSEDAGNEYMGKDVVIDVLIEAAQYTSEYDSFDNQYDKQEEEEQEPVDYALWYDIDAMSAYCVAQDYIEDGETVPACDSVTSVTFTNQPVNEADYEVTWNAPLNTVAHWDFETTSVVYTFTGEKLQFTDKTLLRFGTQKLSDGQLLNIYNATFTIVPWSLPVCVTAEEMFAALEERYIPKAYAEMMLSNAYVYSGVETITGLEYFDVSKVTDFSSMFFGLDEYASDTLDISTWDTSCAVDMSRMFSDLPVESIILGDKWSTANVTDMSDMFRGNQDLTEVSLAGWDTSKVTDMDGMFYMCNKLEALTGIEKWDVSNVESMASMFTRCETVTEFDLDEWNTAKVTTMKGMFAGVLVSSLDISLWNTAEVTDMNSMFQGCVNLKHIYVGGGWSTAKVTESGSMFANASLLPNYDLTDAYQTASHAHTGTGGYLETKS